MKTHPHPPKRRHKPSHSVPPATHSTPVNPLKSKIRDVTRVLEHAVDLPAGVRVEKERELAGYRQDLDRALEEKRKQQMIKKYHMVRFFGRTLSNYLATLATPEFADHHCVKSAKKLRGLLRSSRKDWLRHHPVHLRVPNYN